MSVAKGEPILKRDEQKATIKGCGGTGTSAQQDDAGSYKIVSRKIGMLFCCRSAE